MDEQIMQALEKIQEICKNSSCDKCPFDDNDGNCMFSSECTPNAWSLNRPSDIYHYFR